MIVDFIWADSKVIQAYLDARGDKLLYFLHHQIMEMWVEPVQGTVNADGNVGTIHLVQQDSETWQQT